MSTPNSVLQGIPHPKDHLSQRKRTLESRKSQLDIHVRQLAFEQDEVSLGEKIAILEEEMQKLVARSED